MVDFSSFFQALALGLGVLDALATCQIDDVQLGRPLGLNIVNVHSLRANVCCEYRVGARRLTIHICACNGAVQLASLDQRRYVSKIFHEDLSLLLEDDATLGVLTHLQLLRLVSIEKIENLLVINLGVRADHFEAD